MTAWEKSFGRFTVVATPVGTLETNCYLVLDPQLGVGVVIDPGADEERLKAVIARHSAKVAGIVLTHGHSDHLGVARELAEAWSCSIFLHPDDAGMAATFGLGSFRPLRGGENLDLDGIRFEVLHVPGHSAGSVALLLKPAAGEAVFGPVLFSGDTVFARGVGRTWGEGDDQRLCESIRTEILPLADGTQVLPGHGPAANMLLIKAWLPRFLEQASGR